MSLLLFGLVGVVLVFTIFGGGFLLWKRAPQRYALHKGAMASALKVAHEGHDVVAQVEWSDGNATFLGADYKPGDEQIVLDNGLPIEVVGHGGDPIYIGGIPVIKVKAEHATPVDTRTAIAMGREEDGDYKIKYEDGSVVENSEVEDIDGSVSMDDVSADVDDPEEMLKTDGSGHATKDVDVVDRQYDLSAKGENHGIAFSLRDATDYAPFTLTPGALKKAYDIGKREGANSSPIKVFLMGMGVILAILLFLAVVGVAVWKILGLGGGGGGGSNSGGTVTAVLPLLAMGVPATADIRDRIAAAFHRFRRDWTARRSVKTLLYVIGVYTLLGVAIFVFVSHIALFETVMASKSSSPESLRGILSVLFVAGNLGVWSYALSKVITADEQPWPTVTVSEYEQILELDDGARKYASIAQDVGVSRRDVRAVLQDGDFRVVQDVHPKLLSPPRDANDSSSSTRSEQSLADLASEHAGEPEGIDISQTEG